MSPIPRDVTMDATTGNQYLYDGEGRVCAVESTSAPGFTTMTGYSYDLLGRMVSEKTAGSSPYAQWGLAQSYDRYGNRLSQSVTAGSGPQTSLSFNGNNQPEGYTFDASGNMTVEPLAPPNDMTYDGENRMTAFSGGGGGASYSYDGNGMRVIKSVSGGTTTVSIFSGSSVIAEYDGGAAPSAPSREYIYNGAGDTTGLLAMISGGTTTYYHQDQLSVRLTTDANGNVVTQEGHYPFGEQWYETGPTNKWFFTSYDQDSESGLDYALARYYDSRTGTFCSADPLAGDPSDPQSWNRYPYGRNDPIDITDPSGQSWWSSLLIDIGVGVASYFLGPEIEAWLGIGGGAAGGGAAAAQAQTAADVASGAAIPSATPGLFYRGAASAISAGVDASAGAGGGAAWGFGGAAAAQAAQSSDPSRQQQRGVGPIDTGASINNAKNSLSKNCDSAFKNKMPGYTKSGFFNSLASTAISQYPAGTPNMPAHDFGVDATTAVNAPGRPISLWPNFYGNSAQYQMFTLVHEGIHHFIGWTDNQVFQHFHSSGLAGGPGPDDVSKAH